MSITACVQVVRVITRPCGGSGSSPGLHGQWAVLPAVLGALPDPSAWAPGCVLGLFVVSEVCSKVTVTAGPRAQAAWL